MKTPIHLLCSILSVSVLLLSCNQEEDPQYSSNSIQQETLEPDAVETTTPASESTNSETTSTETTSTETTNTEATITETPTVSIPDSTATEGSTTENAAATLSETTEIESTTSSETSEIAPSESESPTDNTESSSLSETEVETGNDQPLGPAVWEGPTLTFSKADGADPGAETNQDRLTNGVWITRGNGGGQIYNAAVSSSADKTNSPLGTEWAVGGIANKDILTFQNFRAAVNNKPKNMVGTNMVVHLIEEDIYLSIRFTSWSSGQKGGFTYERSTP